MRKKSTELSRFHKSRLDVYSTAAKVILDGLLYESYPCLIDYDCFLAFFPLVERWQAVGDPIDAW
jgi:hypothetical protein